MGWKEIRKGSLRHEEFFGFRHRFEHWYVDSQACFITARVRGHALAFESPEARAVFCNGCLRDERQARRTDRYVLTQSRRHGSCSDPSDYPDTKCYIDPERAIRRSPHLEAFLEAVPCKGYQGHVRKGMGTRWDA